MRKFIITQYELHGLDYEVIADNARDALAIFDSQNFNNESLVKEIKGSLVYFDIPEDYGMSIEHLTEDFPELNGGQPIPLEDEGRLKSIAGLRKAE